MTVHPSVFRLALAVFALGLGHLLAQAADTQPAKPAAAHIVKLSGLGYQPATLTVHPGERISWLNDDLIVHTVTAADHSFDSGDIPSGKSWTFTVHNPGTFHYGCRYHPNMTGSLVVK